MSLIADEVQELRQMSKQLAAGKIDAKYVETQMKIYKETHKRADLVLKMLVACNKPHRIANTLHDMNVISKGETVRPVVEIEMETIQCPDRNDKIITRQECFDYSGEQGNLPTCKSCPNFKITRNLILPKE